MNGIRDKVHVTRGKKTERHGPGLHRGVCGVGLRQVAEEDATFDPLFTWTDPIGAGIV